MNSQNKKVPALTQVDEELWTALREIKEAQPGLRVLHQPYMEGRKKPNPIVSLKVQDLF